jgi:hypothetical protein
MKMDTTSVHESPQWRGSEDSEVAAPPFEVVRCVT